MNTQLQKLPIGNPSLQEDYCNILKGFYGALKFMDD